MRTLWIFGLAIVLGLGAACSHSEEKAESAAATPPAAADSAPAMTTPEPTHEATSAPAPAEEAKPAKKSKKGKKK